MFLKTLLKCEDYNYLNQSQMKGLRKKCYIFPWLGYWKMLEYNTRIAAFFFKMLAVILHMFLLHNHDRPKYYFNFLID